MSVQARAALAVLVLAWLSGVGSLAIAAEKVILERISPYTTIFVSEDHDGLRTLRFQRIGARQSVVKLGDPDHLELPYTRVIPVAFLFVEQPKSALVIGLGGGTIPGFLRKRFATMRIDVVDIDPEVVAVAKSHFGFREDQHMKAHVEDGRRFVEQTKARYDLVFLDGFGTDSVPAHLTTREFLSAVRGILNAGGMVVGNLWGRDVNRLYDSMVKTYRDVYDDVLIVDVIGSGNKILLASTAKFDVSQRELLLRAQTVSQRMRLRNGLTEIVERNIRAPGDDGISGKVLTDVEANAAGAP